MCICFHKHVFRASLHDLKSFSKLFRVLDSYVFEIREVQKNVKVRVDETKNNSAFRVLTKLRVNSETAIRSLYKWHVAQAPTQCKGC